MAQVVVSFTVKDQVVTAGEAVAGFKVSVDNQPDQTVVSSPATFGNVDPGDYTATVQAVQADGTSVGDPQSAKFNVPVPTSTVQVPDVVSVTVGP